MKLFILCLILLKLNPIERLWQYMKDKIIKNKIYETLLELEDTVCEFIKNLDQNLLNQLC